MISRLVHFSDLHIRLFKDHSLYRSILTNALSEWKSLKPDRISPFQKPNDTRTY